MNTSKPNQDWLFEITPKRSLLEINLKEIWRYRDLLVLFIRRNVVAIYKQTILGPLWFFIQPIFTSIIQFVVFGKIAEIPSDGVPYFLFVLSGNTLWNFFSTSLTNASNTFRGNANIFGKVYFPRAIMPIATTASGLLKFFIQLGLFIVVLVYSIYSGADVSPNVYLLSFPFIIIVMALIAMGLGMIITSLTTKYRDFSFFMGFAMSLFMYLTPVIYPTSLAVQKAAQAGVDSRLIYLNPLTGLFDLFRFSFFGEGQFSWFTVVYSVVFSVVVYFVGLVVFNRTEKSFMDTI